MTDRDRREPPTREGATSAGWRYAASYPGASFVLRHSGLEQGRWRMLAEHDRIGFAVAAFKTARADAKFGALAVWTNGRLDRFETISTGPQLGKMGKRGA
jgi:hypothetical protein